MRLTLRTLLAYLDDILEPAEAREIGSKIAESSYASSLVSKIKDVVRRRRIAAPELSGPNATPDPNIVAEYLDNTLAPESVADLERVCLESDVHLAEVAACHQVLTLVRSEAVDIPSGVRERMYALGAVAANTENDGEGPASPHVPRVAGVAAADLPRNIRPGSGEATLEDRLPEALLRRRRSWTRLLPYAVGVAIVGVWAYLMVNDETLTGIFATTTDPATSNLAENLPADDPEVAQEPAPRQDPAADESTQVASIPRSAVAPPDLTMSPQPTTEPGRTVPTDEALPVIPVVPESPPPAEQQVADATPETDRPVAPNDAIDSPIDVPQLPEPFPVQDASASGILLHYREIDDDWFVLRPRSAIHPQEQVTAPEPFDATFTVGDDGKIAEVSLVSGTRVQSLGSSEGSRFGFRIVEGRMVIRRKDELAATESLSVRLEIRSDSFLVTLLEPGTVVGVEVVPLLPTGEGDDAAASGYHGGIAITEGAATVELAGPQSVSLQPAAGWLPFPGEGGLSDEPQPLTSLPNWLNPQSTTASAIVRRYAALYEDEFLPDQPISQSIRPVVKDRRPPLSELATETLALTGSYPGLVDALSSTHEEARVAAIHGLMAWLPRSPEHAGQLQVELQNRFRAAEADAIYRLLWGFGEQDARNPLDSEDLVNWLGHDEIAIRELAFFHIHRLTDRRYDYRPNDPPAQRAAAIERWRRYLDENGALLAD